MLELDDIQHFLLTRPPALAAHYAFVSFRDASQGRRWLAGLLDKVGRGTLRAARRSRPTAAGSRSPSPGTGSRALGVDDASLATFPEEFRQGMAARAEVLGDTGANHPDHWVGGLATPGPPRHRHPVRARRGGTRALRRRIRAIRVGVSRRRS